MLKTKFTDLQLLVFQVGFSIKRVAIDLIHWLSGKHGQRGHGHVKNTTKSNQCGK